jgi:hypothetical protein
LFSGTISKQEKKMAKKGIRRQALKAIQQNINQQENRAFYQNGSDWKHPATDRERTERRQVVK